MDAGVTQRRHNPVDSICRKLQTIRRRDEEANSPFPIPKLQSSSYDSPRMGLRHNLEAVLRRRCVQPDDHSKCEGSVFSLAPTGSPAPGTPSCSASTPRPTLCSASTPRPAFCSASTPWATSCSASTPRPTSYPSAYMSTPSTPTTPVNATYTVTGTLREKGGAALGHTHPRQWSCSTPAAQSGDPYVSFVPHCPTPTEEERGSGKTLAHTMLSYNLNFASSSNILDAELPCPTLVVKRLSMGDGAAFPVESMRDMTEVSLICEEDLLDTIFQACDTQCRGRVCVSHIVDYLRHTTSRSSEDSGLEGLVNMLDPERKDISIDLQTYHAIMKEWIEDCRNQGKNSKEDLTQESARLPDSLTAKRSLLLNLTSGSLEAFGGEVSRAELETSDLVFCVADLQFNNQKLQQEVVKLKQTVEALEEMNQRVVEEKEQLETQAREGQLLLQKERMLKEEVEEMKMSLSSSEESRARASAQSKHVEKENQTLLTKIATLEEENTKAFMEVDELQKKMQKLCDLNADLQVQTHSFDAVIAEKDALIQEKGRQTEELRADVEEYSSVTELLRAEKSKLEKQIQLMLMQPDLAILNQTSSGSLQTELALAQQNPPEGVECFSSSISLASPLDVTLDREVLLLLRGPTPEQTAVDFRTLLTSLRQDFDEDRDAVLTELRGLVTGQGTQEPSADRKLQGLQDQLERRRGEWACTLGQLQLYTNSLERELTKAASDMRRAHTDVLHLSISVQEQENHKQQLQEELDQLKTEPNSRETSSQTPATWHQVTDERGHMPEWVLPDPRANGESPAMHDSGVKSEEDLGGSGLFQRSAPDHVTDRETIEVLLVGEEGLQGDLLQQVHAHLCHVSLLQEEARLPECTGPADAHEQAVCCDASESVSLSPSHTWGIGGLSPSRVEVFPGDVFPGPLPEDQGSSTQVPSLPDELLPPETSAAVPPTSVRPETDRAMPVCPDLFLQTGAMERGPEGEQAVPSSTSGLQLRNSHTHYVRNKCFQPPHARMCCRSWPARLSSHAMGQRLNVDQFSDVSAVLDRSGLLPVVEEEEPLTEAGHQVTEGNTAGMTKTGGGGTATAPNLDSTSGSPPTLGSRARKDSEISRNMEAIEEQRVQEDSQASVDPKNADDTSVISEDNRDATNHDSSSLSSNDKETEAEFHRLSLSCKCDMFTLEKRLRLEERSRDLAEENVRREVSSCHGLLQALTPRCEDDGQAMEIIQRLQKNLDILIQATIRVSSRSEMLGAIHQESRMGKAVEVMIHHVENLRRTYTKEHAELLELREGLLQNERSFSTERDDFRTNKQPGFNKPATRRSSIAVIPRGVGGFPLDMAKDSPETDTERLARRSPWNIVGRSSPRAPLKRFVSSGGWPEAAEPGLSSSSPSPPAEPTAPCPVKTQPSSAPRSPWVWLTVLVVMAGFLALLGSLMLQPAVDAAPVGTGDSWMTIQQLLWPYTGLRHNGQPPV